MPISTLGRNRSLIDEWRGFDVAPEVKLIGIERYARLDTRCHLLRLRRIRGDRTGQTETCHTYPQRHTNTTHTYPPARPSIQNTIHKQLAGRYAFRQYASDPCAWVDEAIRYDSQPSIGISFDVHAGEAFGFLGPNGAGKTSTMRMIACASPVERRRAARAEHGSARGRQPHQGAARRRAAAGQSRHRDYGPREPADVRAVLRYSAARRQEARRRAARLRRAGRSRRRAGRVAVGRHEAAADDCARARERARSDSARRADDRPRSAGAPRRVGAAVSVEAPRSDAAADHALYG